MGAGSRFPLVDPLPSVGARPDRYAANHADGRVLVVAQGPRAACQKLLQLLQGDTTPGRVAKVVADWSQSTEQITGFSER